jgi:hypothetical protein
MMCKESVSAHNHRNTMSHLNNTYLFCQVSSAVLTIDKWKDIQACAIGLGYALEGSNLSGATALDEYVPRNSLEFIVHSDEPDISLLVDNVISIGGQVVPITRQDLIQITNDATAGINGTQIVNVTHVTMSYTLLAFTCTDEAILQEIQILLRQTGRDVPIAHIMMHNTRITVKANHATHIRIKNLFSKAGGSFERVV